MDAQPEASVGQSVWRPELAASYCEAHGHWWTNAGIAPDHWHVIWICTTCGAEQWR